MVEEFDGNNWYIHGGKHEAESWFLGLSDAMIYIDTLGDSTDFEVYNLHSL